MELAGTLKCVALLKDGDISVMAAAALFWLFTTKEEFMLVWNPEQGKAKINSVPVTILARAVACRKQNTKMHFASIIGNVQ